MKTSRDFRNKGARKVLKLRVTCIHPFKRLHWVDDVVFCNKCGKTLHKH